MHELTPRRRPRRLWHGDAQRPSKSKRLECRAQRCAGQWPFPARLASLALRRRLDLLELSLAHAIELFPSQILRELIFVEEQDGSVADEEIFRLLERRRFSM